MNGISSSDKILHATKVFEPNHAGIIQKKPRYLLLILKKDAKVRFARGKLDSNNEYQITKSWRLEEIKRLDGRMLPEFSNSFTIAIEKNLYEFACETSKARVEFLWNFLKACRTYLSKVPILKNINEQRLEEIMDIRNPTEKEGDGSTTSSKLSTIPEYLQHFDWDLEDAAMLESRLLEELLGLEAANAFALVECGKELSQITNKINDALKELDVMDDWFGQYNVQLQRMHDDIMQIEKTNNTTQMLAINELTLLESLETLINCITLDDSFTKVLEQTTLKTPSEIAAATEAARELERILSQEISEFVGMNAVEEKINFLRELRLRFSTKLEDRLYSLIELLVETCSVKSRLSKRGDLRLYNHKFVHDQLLQLRDLTKWLEVVNPRKLSALEDYYVQQFHKIYKREIKVFLEELRQHHLLKSITDENEEITFSNTASSFPQPSLRPVRVAQLKGSGGTKDHIPRLSQQQQHHQDHPKSTISDTASTSTQASTATAKSEGRSHLAIDTSNKLNLLHSVSQEVSTPTTPKAPTLSRHARNLLGVSSVMGKKSASSTIDVSQLNLDGSVETVTRLDISTDKLSPEEAFSQVLKIIFPIFLTEDQFLLDCFHGVRSDSAADTFSPETDPDLDDGVSISGVSTLSGAGTEIVEPVDVSEVKAVISEAKKSSTSRVVSIFDFLYKELMHFCESGVKNNPLVALTLIETMAEFRNEQTQKQSPFFVILNLIESNKLRSTFEKFIDDQVHSILDTKVTAQKRPGLLSHIKKFPNFIGRMEKILKGGHSSLARDMVDKAYSQIFKALFEWLNGIAQTADPNVEKEVINVHVIYIENYHHIWSQVAQYKVASFEQSIKEVKKTYERHLNAYVNLIMKRPMGKLYEFFDGIDALLLTRTVEEVSYQLAFNKAALKKCLSQYPAPTIKKAIEQLYKRINKHFCEEEGLKTVVWRSVQEELYRKHAHFVDLIEKCYPGSGVSFAYTYDELVTFSQTTFLTAENT